MPQFSGDLLARLSAFATGAFGLRFPPDRWTELARGVASAALELGISDLEGWAEAVAAGGVPPDHVAELSNHLTISETYFFRHPETFTALERDMLPARIAERRQHSSALRIWSAGCASGEEPYSVAILLRQRFPDFAAERTVIHGTDINTRVLGRAMRGLYTEWSFRDAPAWLKQAHFKRTPHGRYEVAAEIRQMVHFTQLNLAAPIYPGKFGERGDFDVILCRNVLMYFSAEWQMTILRRFTKALAEGGWLMVGPCDVMAEQAEELGLRSTRPGTFKKVSEEETARHDDRPAMPLVLAGVDLAPPATDTPFATPAAAIELLPEPLAAATTTELSEADPATADVLSSHARSHADRGQLDDALAACDEAVGLDPLRADLHHLRACILLELNRPEDAEEAFRRVLYLDHDFAMAQFALGSLAKHAGRTEEARHHFSVLLRSLAPRRRGEAVPHSEGLTVARLQEVVQRTLNDTAA